MAAPTTAACVKKALANPEPSTHGPGATGRQNYPNNSGKGHLRDGPAANFFARALEIGVVPRGGTDPNLRFLAIKPIDGFRVDAATLAAGGQADFRNQRPLPFLRDG
jgi:hypothetical protein